MTKSIYYNGGGIDNFAIEASCGGGRRAEGRPLLDLSLAQTQRMVPFYCTSDDFPCEDGSKTMFCHYSTRRGYQTFCIPEADSEILRFYSMITADLASAVT
jgi:hypothetical protein